MVRNLLLLGAVAVGLAVSGCRITTAPETVQLSTKEVSVTSRTLARWLEIGELRKADRDGKIEGQVTVWNRKTRDCQFEYIFHWLDEDGLEIDTPASVWVPISLAGKQQKNLKSTAPTNKATDFLLEARFRFTSERW